MEESRYNSRIHMHYLPQKLWLIKELCAFNSHPLLQVTSYQVEKKRAKRTLLTFNIFKSTTQRVVDLKMLKVADAMSVKINLNKYYIR